MNASCSKILVTPVKVISPIYTNPSIRYPSLALIVNYFIFECSFNNSVYISFATFIAFKIYQHLSSKKQALTEPSQISQVTDSSSSAESNQSPTASPSIPAPKKSLVSNMHNLLLEQKKQKARDLINALKDAKQKKIKTLGTLQTHCKEFRIDWEEYIALSKIKEEKNRLSALLALVPKKNKQFFQE